MPSYSPINKVGTVFSLRGIPILLGKTNLPFDFAFLFSGSTIKGKNLLL